MRNPLAWLFGKPRNILFLGGLSGAGKSSFARDYLQGKRGWHHIEIDVPAPGDGITDNGLRVPWDTFQPTTPNEVPRPRRLDRAIMRRAAGHTHVVLSFSSMQVFSERQPEAGEGFFHFAYLAGPPDLCRQGFFDRLEQEGIISGPSPEAERHWKVHNEKIICELKLPHNQGLLVPAFEPDGTRRDPEAIYRDLLEVMGRE